MANYITAWGITLVDIDNETGVLFGTRGPLEDGGPISGVVVTGEEHVSVRQEIHAISCNRLAESPVIDRLLA